MGVPLFYTNSSSFRKQTPVASFTKLALLAVLLHLSTDRLGSHQVSAKEETVSCSIDEDCKPLNDYFICVDAPEDSEFIKQCEHKGIFPMTVKEIIGTFVFALVMLLSTVAGIGGGGVAIPLAMFFFNLSMKPAIAISSFSIMVTTISRWLFNINERHPEKPHCVCLDYGMASVMMPLTILGSMIGAYFYNAFPDLYLQVILTLLLAFLAFTSVKKGIQITKKENEMFAKKAALSKVQPTNEKPEGVELTEKKGDEAGTTKDTILQKGEETLGQETQEAALKSGDYDQIVKALKVPDLTGDAEHDKEVGMLRRLVYQEMGHGQWKKQGFNILCLLLLVITSLLRGGKWDLSFDKCSAADWISVAVLIALLSSIIYFATVSIAEEQKVKKKYGDVNIVESDLVFEGTVLKMVLGLGFGGGWVAGALGLGGGVIFNPLLLQMGVPPRVSSATGLYLVLFSKISTCVLYFIFGELLLDYGFWIGFWSSVGGILGVGGANWYMAKFGRQSIIVWVLNFMLVISVVGVPYFGVLDLIKMNDNGIDIFAFKTIC